MAIIEGNNEKINAALTSVIAAVALTTFKLIVGLSTAVWGYWQKLPIQALIS